MFLKYFDRLLVGLSLLACASAFAAPLTVDLNGVESNGLIDNPSNTVLLFDVGAGAHVTGISYSLNLTAFDPGRLADIALAFTNTGFVGVLLHPGFAETFPGTRDYANSIDLAGFGLDFFIGADGILRLEFYEDIDDLAYPDGIWNSGTITFDIAGDDPGPSPVPEPATALLLGGCLALVGCSRRRAANRQR